MSNYNSLKATIDANIKQNGKQEITGQILNSVLNQMVNILGAGYQFAGVATIDTNPGTPDAKVFYIANGKGTYEKFGGINVTEDDVVVLYWDTAWHKLLTGIASQDKLSELENEITTKQDIISDLDSIRAGAALGASAIQKETDPNVPSWAKEATKPSYTPAEVGAASEEALQSHVNNSTRHITATERAEWSAKQDALTLTIKDNGNIVLANIQGQTKEFMPATPSGDPMHYAYVTAGAEYNDTGKDIVKTTPWADMLDDDYDGDYGKTVIHKAGYWYLNGLGDINNDEIRKLYQATSNFPSSNNLNGYFSWVDFRTNFKGLRPLSGWTILTCSGIADGSHNFIILDLSGLKSVYIDDINGINKIKHILGEKFIFSKAQKLDLAFNLITARFKGLSKNIYIGKTSVLSVKSVLYMIQNEAATSPITITLHADVYNRCMVNADILAALEKHPNVSLASA